MTTELSMLLFVICFVGSAFFSGMETGVISIHPLRLKHMVKNNINGAVILDGFLKRPDHLLGTTLVGTNICNVVCSIMATRLAVGWLGTAGYATSTVIVTILILVGGEYLPKAWFQSHPLTRSIPFAKPLQLFGHLFFPLSWFATKVAKMLVPAPASDTPSTTSFITKEELIYLTSEGEQSGELSTDERRMINGVISLAEKSCKDIMIQRGSILTIDHDAPSEDILRLARTKGWGRFPVYKREAKRFVGILHIVDLLIDREPAGKKAHHYMRPPQFVTGETKLTQLLPRMRLSQQPMALVTDTRSTVTGLITIHDIIEEIQGLSSN